MARVSSGAVSISNLNSVLGFGNSLGSYKRASTSVKSNTIAFAPVGNPVSMDRLRGSFPSGTYRDINTYASSSTTAVNVTPRNPVISYSAGLSNNADPANAYTLFSFQASGNRGSSATSNVFSQTAVTDSGGINGMYFRIANGTMFPFASAFEEPGAWVVAVGLNYFNWFSGDIFFTTGEIFQFYGDGNNYNVTLGATLDQMYDGNNFFAVFVSGGSQQFGLVNRAQLRAGVIQPVIQIGMFGPDSINWYNSMQNVTFRHGIFPQSGSRSVQLQIGWDEMLVRGYDLPPEAAMAGTGFTTTRAKVTNPGTAQFIQGKIFE